MIIKKSRNVSIDFFRLLGAFSVIFIHLYYGELNSSNSIFVLVFRSFCRWAVPFFFICSGYFFEINYTKSGNSAFLKMLQNLLTVTLIADTLYFFVSVIEKKSSGVSFEGKFNILNSFSVGSYFHLWFLHSLIIGLLFIWLIISKEKKWMLNPLAIILFIICLVTNGYAPLLHISINPGFSMILSVFPFFILGYKLSETKFAQTKLSSKIGVVLVLGGLILHIAEAYCIQSKTGFKIQLQQILVGTALMSLGMFSIALHTSFTKYERHLVSVSKYSLPIYLYHPLLLMAILHLSIIRVNAFYSSNVFLFFLYLICCLTCVLIVIILDKWFPKMLKLISGG